MGTMGKGLRISKWGNGQGVRLPISVMKLLSLRLGDELKMDIENEKIVLTPKNKKKTLAERFESYTGNYKPEEYWDDNPIGKEVF